MDKKLDFLTKDLIEQAAKEIDKTGIPDYRDASKYLLVIGKREYPYKLLVTEAAKIAKVNLDSYDFGSSDRNRKGMEKITGYKFINKSESISINDLSTKLKELFNEIWRCADSSKWNYLKDKDLLAFDWINKNTNYKEIDINSLARGKKALKPWVNSLEIGDLIFIMGGNTYSGIAIARSTYSFDGPFIDMGGSNEIPAIRIQYIHKVNNPIKHNIKTHNNPTTFAKIDQYKFGLENVLSFLKKEAPDAITAIINYINSMEHSKYIDLLKYKKQIILQGPPGTGKTYTAKDIAEQMITGSVNPDKTEQKKILESSGQFVLIQFHPAYTYEDFVRGITAKSVDGQIEYVTENKILADFADKAQKNFIATQKDEAELSKEQKIEQLLEEFAEHIQDKIDEDEEYKITESVAIIGVEEDAFRYSGKWKVSQRMKFKDLVKAQLKEVTARKEFKKVEGISGLARHHVTYFYNVLEKFQERYKEALASKETLEVAKPKLKDYILLIDEINRANLPAVLGELIYALEYRGESVNSIYAIDGDASIIIPENLFIIGTMNTADRSIGHIDYAIRRRFAFENLLPNVDIIETNKGKEYFRIVENLFNNDSLSSDYKNSKEDVQIGHSYFMGEEENLTMRMNYEVIPILREYLKDGIFREEVREKIAQFEAVVSA